MKQQKIWGVELKHLGDVNSKPDFLKIFFEGWMTSATGAIGGFLVSHGDNITFGNSQQRRYLAITRTLRL